MTILSLAIAFMALQGQGITGVRELFDGLADAPPGATAAFDVATMARTLDQLRVESPGEVRALVNNVIRAGRSQNRDARVEALLAIQIIAMRPDGPALVQPAAALLEERLYDSDVYVAGLAAETFASARPPSPSTSIAALRRYVQAERGVAEVKIAAIRSLIRLDPNGAETAEAVGHYFKDHKEPQARSAILYPIGLAHTSNKILVDLVVDALRSEDSDVQSAAVYTVFNSGEPMISAARPTLLELAADPNVRASTRSLLSNWLHGKSQ